MTISAGNHSEQPTNIVQQDQDSHRLPCRGCTRDCNNYSHCNGTPWRSARDPVEDKPQLRQPASGQRSP